MAHDSQYGLSIKTWGILDRSFSGDLGEMHNTVLKEPWSRIQSSWILTLDLSLTCSVTLSKYLHLPGTFFPCL